VPLGALALKTDDRVRHGTTFETYRQMRSGPIPRAVCPDD
jgi:hypothetical protein